MAAMKPEQPVDEVIPPVRLTYEAHRVSLYSQRFPWRMVGWTPSCDGKRTFSSRDNCPTKALALVYDSLQSPLPVPFGLGYTGGLWP